MLVPLRYTAGTPYFTIATQFNVISNIRIITGIWSHTWLLNRILIRTIFHIIEHIKKSNWFLQYTVEINVII